MLYRRPAKSHRIQEPEFIMKPIEILTDEHEIFINLMNKYFLHHR